MVGTTLSHYRIVEKIGEGGMGTVYKAEDTQLQRTVALKFLGGGGRGFQTGDDDQKSRFLHEARAAAALDHPNICGIYEIADVDDQTFLAMPFLEGEALDLRIQKGPLKISDAVEVAIQTADALEEAHSKGVIHRDIKPGNIMILDAGRGRLRVKLMDFGLALLSQATRLTREGSQLGTAAYMAPEQAHGETVDARTDVWALGAVIYEMVAGSTPFPAEYEQAMFYAITNEAPEPLTAVRTGVPMELERICFKCMAKQPAERYQSMTDLLVDLTALRNELSGSSRRPSAAKAIGSGVTAPVATAHSAVEDPEAAAAIPGRTIGRGWPTAVAAAALAALATWALMRAPVTTVGVEPDYQMRRVTWDGNLVGFPALSPDGTLLAYASDRSGRGDLDIWVQQVAGGDPTRITDDPVDELQPSFSPDGSQIVFSRRPGGIYTIQALGSSDPYLVAENAYAPSFGPAGKQVAYLHDNELFYSPVSMGEPVRLLAGMTDFGPPLWSPDGESLLVHAVDAGGVADWVMAPLGGWTPKRLGAMELFKKHGMSLPEPRGWSWTEEGLLIGDARGDLIRVGIGDVDPTLSNPNRITFGAGFDAMPSVSDTGVVAFASLEASRNLWGIELDRSGAAQGTPLQFTEGAARDEAPDTTLDGAKLAYISRRPDLGDIHTRDLSAGKTANLTNDDADQRFPVLDAKGERIVYLAEEDGKPALYVRPFDGGLGRKVCTDCGLPTSWSADGGTVLYDRGDPVAIWALDLESGKQRAVIESPDGAVWQGRFSPDGRTVVFRFNGAGRGGPVRRPAGPGSERWVE